MQKVHPPEDRFYGSMYSCQSIPTTRQQVSIVNRRYEQLLPISVNHGPAVESSIHDRVASHRQIKRAC
jgi:hypothetical protein